MQQHTPPATPRRTSIHVPDAPCPDRDWSPGMSRPSARVGRNRRRAFLYVPLLALGVLMVLTSTPLNGLYVLGALVLLLAAGGFILESGAPNASRN